MMSYRLGTVNDFYWGFKPVLSYSFCGFRYFIYVLVARVRLAEETCVVDCYCPCGWVAPPENFTQAQIQAKVLALQEKLKLDKTKLSSVVSL